MSTIIFPLILFTLTLFYNVCSKLIPVSPSALVDTLNGRTEDIDFSMSHYGSIPFGAHLVGKLVLANPIDGCDTIELPTTYEESSAYNVIAVVTRGGCRVVSKSRNGQAAGAKVVLIVNDHGSQPTEWFGHEHGADDVKIATIMISNKDGEKIIQYLQQQASKPKSAIEDPPLVNIKFPAASKLDIVNLDFWYSSGDASKVSFQFLSRSFIYWKRNRGSLKFTPHFFVWTCSRCQKSNFQDLDEPGCISGGRYCAADPDASGHITGRDIVMEDLNQACIFKVSEDVWWRYAIDYEKKCINTQNSEGCGVSLLHSVATLDQVALIQTCIGESFVKPEGSFGFVDPKLYDNKILRDAKELQIDYGISQIPALFINGKAYEGKLNSYQVYEEICRNFKDMPNDCKWAMRRTNDSEVDAETIEDHSWRILFIIVVMTIFAVSIVYCFKRIAKRDGRKDKLEVGGLVTRYFALKDMSREENKEDVHE